MKEGSAADAEGIKEGDLITKVVRDRKIQPLASVKEFQDLASKSDELSFYVQSGKAAGPVRDPRPRPRSELRRLARVAWPGPALAPPGEPSLEERGGPE